jgi:hypothetical protein
MTRLFAAVFTTELMCKTYQFKVSVKDDNYDACLQLFLQQDSQTGFSCVSSRHFNCDDTSCFNQLTTLTFVECISCGQKTCCRTCSLHVDR